MQQGQDVAFIVRSHLRQGVVTDLCLKRLGLCMARGLLVAAADNQGHAVTSTSATEAVRGVVTLQELSCADLAD